MVLRNVAKTFSLEEQRQEINEIAVDLDAVNTTLTNWNAANWDTAYSWGDHAQAGYLVATASSYNNTNWDTAYGWGDHAQGGYLTAYQTDAQIKSSYEANADTNAFTDALLTKLNGIETGATADQTASEIKTAYESNADTNAFTDALQTKLNGIETNATADQTASEIKTAYESNADTNAFTDALQTKLNGIATGAEVNLDPGGTFGGAGTAQDPAIGSIQFKNTGNTFGGDSTFLYNNTNNRLTLGTTTFDVGGTPSGTVAAFSVSTTEGSGIWATQIRSDNTAGNGLFLRAGNNDSYYTAYFTGYDENNVHFVVRGDGNVGIGNNNPPANFTLHATASSTYEQIEFVRHVRSSSIIAFNGSSGGATKNVSVFLPIQSLKGVVVEYNISTNRFNNGNDQYDDYDVWNLKYENTSVRFISQETALRIQNGGATSSVSAKTHTVNPNGGSGYDASFTINGEYDGYLVVTMRGSGVVGAPIITIT